MEKKYKIRELDKKERLPYIWEYYKLPIIGTVIGVIIVISIIKSLCTPKKTDVMDVVLANANMENALTTTLFDDFLTDAGIDPEDHEISVNSSVSLTIQDNGTPSDTNMLQVLVTLFAADAVDTFVCDEDLFNGLVGDEIFVDLSEIVPEDFLEKYEDQLVYATDSDTGEEYPVGMKLNQSEILNDSELFYTEDNVIGFSGFNDDHTVQREFLYYLMGEDY